jgi:toxin YoeB
MKHKITIESQALKDINYFKKKDRDILQKIKILLNDIALHPYEGLGKPEPLRFELSGYWSRRITREHRIIYKVMKNGEVVVISCRFHYTER